MSKKRSAKTRGAARGWIAPVILGTAAAAAAAWYNHRRARTAEDRNPPVGRFLTVDGVRLHYLERGTGPALVLVHGNGMMIQDFLASGLVDRLSRRYRVIVFDRPGYGYSDRPRGLWTPRAHATLFEHALDALGIDEALVLGHSWGTLVAAALALQAPHRVRGLVLAAGYYFPTLRADVILFSPPAIPVVGDAMRYTISPPLARLMLPGLIAKLFQPAPVTERFDREIPKEMMLRPIHLRAAAEDAALMTPAAAEMQDHYGEIEAPVAIITGADDQIADVGRQSHRLHGAIPHSTFEAIPGLGHMIHHLAPDAVARAVDRVAEEAASRETGRALPSSAARGRDQALSR
ncbi:MAG TPA: alpha/beta hydrolase [Microvirga sp.]|jgi:pimeloyl-ACP methyl ester carboxylesterase|nr:alpha/beta hydrolase [Microvirga sp.]